MTSTIKENEDTNIVTFVSYNSTGLKNIKTNWVNEVCEEEQIDYFSIQEHFKNNKNTERFLGIISMIFTLTLSLHIECLVRIQVGVREV